MYEIYIYLYIIWYTHTYTLAQVTDGSIITTTHHNFQNKTSQLPKRSSLHYDFHFDYLALWIGGANGEFITTIYSESDKRKWHSSQLLLEGHGKRASPTCASHQSLAICNSERCISQGPEWGPNTSPRKDPNWPPREATKKGTGKEPNKSPSEGRNKSPWEGPNKRPRDEPTSTQMEGPNERPNERT